MTLDLDALEAAGLTGALTPLDLAQLHAEEVAARATNRGGAVPELEGDSSGGAAPGPAVAPSTTTRVTVTLEDGTAWDMTLDARDRRAYALMADRYHLPAFTVDVANPDVLKLELLTVFSSWYAARHRLALTGLDWPAFNAQVIDLAVHADAPAVAPHPPGPGGA